MDIDTVKFLVHAMLFMWYNKVVYLNQISEFREKILSQSTKQTQAHLNCRNIEFPFLFNTKVILKPCTHEKISMLSPKYINCLTHFVVHTGTGSAKAAGEKLTNPFATDRYHHKKDFHSYTTTSQPKIVHTHYICSATPMQARCTVFHDMFIIQRKIFR